ncbi:DoxX family membrane protein [Rothia sp. AR01]|uniref:DoxX family membrane protein n=1 Tax=Rothia santali TaxID=2949643 RepID=A0A9X2HET6_9MICC|nr:DoxX family membrane protein [Rothia santali]MCP3425929.1 DoxX family membrane protein [Rothia santali]
MTIVRKFARPLLATSFIYNGVVRFRSPEGGRYLTPALDAAAKARPELRALKGKERLIAQSIAGTQIAAGSLFALGRFPRLSSTLLLATGAINTYIDYRAAPTSTKEEKEARLGQGLKNASLVGAVALSSVDTAGNPSLAWRASKFGSDVRKKSSQLGDDLKKKSENVLHH